MRVPIASQNRDRRMVQRNECRALLITSGRPVQRHANRADGYDSRRVQDSCHSNPPAPTRRIRKRMARLIGTPETPSPSAFVGRGAFAVEICQFPPTNYEKCTTGSV